MTEEVKEIIEYLKNDNIEKPFGMATIDKKRLLNYITNLQKENLKLISENEAIKNIKYTVDETIYKSRNEKGLNELITLIQIIGEQPSKNVEEDNWLLSKLESIQIELQGGDE